MPHTTQGTAWLLHEEHMSVLALLERCEGVLAAHGKRPPDTADASMTRFLGDLATAIDGEISDHFAFEEEQLFTRLNAGGYAGMTDILMAEHEIILPMGRRVSEIARAARRNGFTSDGWTGFRQLLGEFIQRLSSHIQKEEMGMLPALDDILDQDTDGELAIGYADRR